MKASILFLAIMIFSLSSCGCLGAADKDGMSSGNYVAIYEEYNDVGALVGNAADRIIRLPESMPVMPFDYNGSMGMEDYYPAINDSFKILYGSWKFYDDPGAYRHLEIVRGIYGYPYTCESGLVILGVYNNGTVLASYNNTSITIPVGDTWKSPASSRVENKELRIMPDNGTSLDFYNSNITKVFTVRYNSTWAVTNKGMFNKTILTIK